FFYTFIILQIPHFFPTRRSSDLSVFYIFKNNSNYVLLFLGDTKDIFIKKIKKYALFSKIVFTDIDQASNFSYLKQITNNQEPILDRKSTRLNSSHVKISYAVICL